MPCPTRIIRRAGLRKGEWPYILLTASRAQSQYSTLPNRSKPFANQEDKDQFIRKLYLELSTCTRSDFIEDATIVVLSQNGSISLEMHDVRLLYSRREDDSLIARIVAEYGGIVKAQVAARDGGKDQNEAFKALRKHIERCLDTILKDVPGAAYSGDKVDARAGPSQQPTRNGVVSPVSPGRLNSGAQQPSSHGINQVHVDAPPAYGKAVKDWRSGNDDKR